MTAPLTAASTTGSCERCRLPLIDSDLGELCPACLFAAGMPSPRVGGYELLQPLDTGGTGVLYVAQHTEQPGLVALKLARDEILHSREAVAAFRHGIQLQVALRELPNIVSIYEFGTHDDGRPFAVMPLLEGGTLAERVKRASDAAGARVEPILDWMISISRAVGLAHARGVLHCDLKPENVLFNLEGEPFVGDFGLARTIEQSGSVHGPSFGGGTPGWMSPEQALQVPTLTTATDVFSLGVMLYWLLTGALPFVRALAL